MVLHGAISGARLAGLTAAYDALMASACGPEFRVGSTTDRMSDLLNHGPAFDDVFLYPPLLEACEQTIGEPFKLSSFVARTLRPKTPAQKLHADLPRASSDGPLFGFILMVDPFCEDNGATRFVPGSHRWLDEPADRMRATCQTYPGEVLALGEAGCMVVFDGAVWHSHSANLTSQARRSIQGYFVRREARSWTDFADCLLAGTQARMTPGARHLLALEVAPAD